MKAFYVTLFTLCLTALSCPDAQARARDPFEADSSQKAKPATIKVLLAQRAHRALVEVKGRYQLFTPSNGLKISGGTFAKREFVYPDPEGLHWGDKFPTIFEMRIVPNDSQTTILVNGTQYRGCVEIYDREGTLYIVNEVDVESYLRAILTTQFSEELDDEVMEAVAIVARTNAYYFLSKNAHSFWHVKAADVHYQGYGATLQNLSVDRAVENTRYMIMLHNSLPFAAAWTKDSGGKTVDYCTIFRKEAATTPGVIAPFAAKDRAKHSWSFTIGKQELARLLQLSSITGIDLYEDKDANKVYALKVHDGARAKNIDFFSFQNRIGERRLRSNDFTVAIKDDTLTFSGFGDGPGTGLCLYSAGQMLEHGDNVQKILAAFFPETRIESARSLPGHK